MNIQVVCVGPANGGENDAPAKSGQFFFFANHHELFLVVSHITLLCELLPCEHVVEMIQ